MFHNLFMPLTGAGGSWIGQTSRMSAEPAEIDRTVLDEMVSAQAEQHHCPTISWGVVRNGALELSGAVGDVSEHTVYRIASMTKSFSAAATLLLRDDGAFRLDDPIGRLVPELASLRSPTTDTAAITLRDLLSMTSGFVTDDAWADRHLDLTDDEFDAIIASGPVFAEPTGTTYEYSNFGYAVLGRVVHRVTGHRIQHHITERLLEPLGMQSTSWVMPDHDDWARPMRWLDDRHGDELAPLDDGLIAPMGGLWTTVTDLASWIAWLDDAYPARDGTDGGPLQRSSRRELQTSQQYVGMRSYGDHRYPTSYCLGHRVLHEPQRGPIVSHSGGFPGYGSNMSWRLGRRLGVIALSNTTYAPMTELGIRMLEQVSSQVDPPPHQRPVPTRLALTADRLVRLLNSWDDVTADALFADNVEPDDSWQRRRAVADRYRPLDITTVTALNDARARIECTTAAARTTAITFALAPHDPAKIQDYDIE